MATRSRRKDARPGEIIAAALASFAERGYAATKLEDVAAAAGISKGTIYLYFPTKEDLFRAVVRQAVLPNLEVAEGQFAAHTGSCADLLRLLAQRFLQLLDSDLTAVPKLVVAESGNFPAIAQFYADTVLRRAFALIEGILTRAWNAASSAEWTSTPPCRCSLRRSCCWRCGSTRSADTPTSPSIPVRSQRHISTCCCAASPRRRRREAHIRSGSTGSASQPAGPAGGGCTARRAPTHGRAMSTPNTFACPPR